MKKISFLSIFAVALSLCSCEREGSIQTYRVAKDDASGGELNMPQSPPAMGGAMGDMKDPHAGLPPGSAPMVSPPANAPGIVDEPPAHWKKQPNSSMRLASYLIEGEGGAMADVSLFLLPGTAGAALPNVNRWRGQVGLGDMTAEEFSKAAETVPTPWGEALVISFVGTSPTGDTLKDGAITGAISDKGNDAWFYKMRGNAALVEKEMAAFKQWISTVKPSAAPAPTPPPATDQAPAPGGPQWTVPEGWVRADTGEAMRYATFRSGDAGAEMAVSHFPGDVGGDLGNVNRWLGQLGLPPVDDAGMANMVTSEGAMRFADISNNGKRMAVGWTMSAGETWFFKLTGPDAAVGGELEHFKAFLSSVRF